MESNGSGRRRFLKHAAALAGVAAGAGAGAEWAARGQSAKPEEQAKDAYLRGESLRRGARMSVDHITYYTPLQDYAGTITPAPLHFVQQHSSHLPEIDAQQHRLTIHGMVDPCLSGCNPYPLVLVFGHAHGRSPAWRSSAPTIAPRVSATFSQRRGLRRLLGEDSLERRVHLPPLSGGGRAVPLR